MTKSYVEATVQIWADNSISGKPTIASEKFFTALNKAINRDKLLCRWGMGFEVTEDNTYEEESK